MVEIQRDGEVTVLFLGRPKVNALSPELVEAIAAGMDRAFSEPGVRAVVLASRLERAFSAGFDLRELDTLSPGEFARFFDGFAELYRRIAAGPVPVVAAVAGHALAGGAILALACERRVFGEGQWGFGLTEVDVGLPLPGGVLELLRSAADETTVYEAAALGRVFTPAEAAERRLAHRIVPGAEVLPAAMDEARALAAKPPKALREIRRMLRGPLGERMRAADRDVGEMFSRWWRGEESTACRRRILERLSAKTGR